MITAKNIGPTLVHIFDDLGAALELLEIAVFHVYPGACGAFDDKGDFYLANQIGIVGKVPVDLPGQQETVKGVPIDDIADRDFGAIFMCAVPAAGRLGFEDGFAEGPCYFFFCFSVCSANFLKFSSAWSQKLSK